MTTTKINAIPTFNSENISKKFSEQPSIKIEVTDNRRSTTYSEQTLSLNNNKSHLDDVLDNPPPVTKIKWQRNGRVPSQEKRLKQSPLPAAKKTRIVKDGNIENSRRNDWSPAQRRPSREWSQDEKEKNSCIKTKTTNDPKKAQYERQKGYTKACEKDKHQNKGFKKATQFNLKTKNTKYLKISQLGNNSDSTSDSDAEDEDEYEEEGKEDDKSKIVKIAEAELKRRSNVERAKQEAKKETEMRKTQMKRMKTNSEGTNSGQLGLNKPVLSESECPVKYVGKDQKTLLEKVNEIILSCVKLKEDKNISEEKLSKANKIIEKAEEKRRKLTNQADAEKKALKESTDADADADADAEKRALKESTDDGRRTPLSYRKSDDAHGEVKEDVDSVDYGRRTPLAYQNMRNENKDAKENNVSRESGAENKVFKENKDDKDDGRRTPHAYRYDRARSESASEFELEVSLDSKIKERLEDTNEKPDKPDTFLEDGELKEGSEAEYTGVEMNDIVETDSKPKNNEMNYEPKSNNEVVKSKKGERNIQEYTSA